MNTEMTDEAVERFYKACEKLGAAFANVGITATAASRAYVDVARADKAAKRRARRKDQRRNR